MNSWFTLNLDNGLKARTSLKLTGTELIVFRNVAQDENIGFGEQIAFTLP